MGKITKMKPENQVKVSKKDAVKLPKNGSKKTNENPFETIFHQVETHLRTNYDLRFNTIKCEIECSPKQANEFVSVNENSLYVELRKLNVKISKDDLKSILKSDFTERYNPIKSYFDSLLSYNPEKEPDYINQFSSYVKAEDQDEFNKHHKKWLVRTVRCALDDTYYNKQAFVLVHDKQDSGKSTYCRFHCPESLNDYQAEEISTDKDGLILLAKNLLINMDELSTLNKSEINSLKSYFSKDKINVRLPYDSKNSNITRKCSFLGSTNKGEFLQDETGSVRWLCFEITAIDWNYREKVIIDNVWRQSLYLLNSGTFKYDLTVDEISTNDTRNMKFQQMTNEMELVIEYFKKPGKEEGEVVEFMMVKDMVAYLQTHSGIKVNREYLGRALTKLKFNRVRRSIEQNQVWGYEFIKIK